MRKKYSTKKITQINRDSISLLYIFTSHFSSQLPALSFCFGFASEILEGYLRRIRQRKGRSTTDFLNNFITSRDQSVVTLPTVYCVHKE